VIRCLCPNKGSKKFISSSVNTLKGIYLKVLCLSLSNFRIDLKLGTP